MEINDKTMADIIVDLIHLSKNSETMHRLSKQQESEIHILNSENQAMIRFIGEELPNKYKSKIIHDYEEFAKQNYSGKLNRLNADDKKAIQNLDRNDHQVSGLLGSQDKSKPLLDALSKLTKNQKH